MSTESVWLRVVAPLSISTLEALSKAAPKGTCIRHGGTVILHGESRNILEFVAVAEQPAENFTLLGEEVQLC